MPETGDIKLRSSIDTVAFRVFLGLGGDSDMSKRLYFISNRKFCEILPESSRMKLHSSERLWPFRFCSRFRGDTETARGQNPRGTVNRTAIIVKM